MKNIPGLFLETPDGIYIPGAELHIALLKARFGPDMRIEPFDYGRPRTIGETTITLFPAGHVYGSAQVLIERGGSRLVFAGDYKRAADPTCEPFEIVPCDTFVSEATFALPIYRWDPPATVIREIFDWWSAAAGRGDECVLFCYSLGKAQRILGELARLTDRPVYEVEDRAADD